MGESCGRKYVSKEKYKSAVVQAKHTVVDVRCPKIKELLEETETSLKVCVPDIHPILIHCGLEASERDDLRDEEKVITTPCQALADMGNAMQLKNTRFVTWNQFLESIGEAPTSNLLEASPIPPGFFKDINVVTVSVTGEDEIKKYLKRDMPEKIQLVEMLFCRDGCHNGDGISNA